MEWHYYKDLRQRNRTSSEIAGRALIFYDSINYQYRNDHIQHQIQEELSSIDKLYESSKFFHSYISSKKVGHLVGPLRLSNGSLTADHHGLHLSK